jgi:membrane-associated phospholipid phosphatase
MNWKSVLAFDDRMSHRMRLVPAGSPWRPLASFLAHSGDSWFWLAGLGLVWLFASPDWHKRSALLILGLVFLAVMVLAIKFTVRRRRPEGDWGAIYRTTDPHSFPSGHASRAAMLAVVALGMGPAWFGLLLLLWAPLVSAARVIMGVHYLSDVLAGFAIGIVMGFVTLAVYPLLVATLPFLF